MTGTRRSRNAGPEGDDRSLHVDHVTLGVCYYPEHGAESLWQDDFRRMRDLGFEIVRMGEFAWSIFEPEEGRFSFDLFDRAIADAARHGLMVILGTPTATPPAWLTTAYPEVLNVTREGVQLQHGLRRHCGYNAPSFHRLATRVVRELAIHYADHPAVIGWQIDNELNCEVDLFYAEADQTAFRDWLRRRYSADLEALNRSWGTVVWNQTYTSWDEIRLPGPTPHDSHNPQQLLDEKRFISDSAISFVRIQTEILRALAPRQWITTNGMFKHLDNHRLTDELLDFFSFDSYPNFSTIRTPILDVNHTDSTTTAGGGSVDPLRDRAWSWLLSIVVASRPRLRCSSSSRARAAGSIASRNRPRSQAKCAYGLTNRSRMAATWCCTSDGERRPSGPRSTGMASTTNTINQIDGSRKSRRSPRNLPPLLRGSPAPPWRQMWRSSPTTTTSGTARWTCGTVH